VKKHTLDYQLGDYVPQIGNLVRIDDVTPPAPAKLLDYVFEVVNYQGHVHFSGGRLSDLSGWTQSGKENALGDCRAFCARHKINRNSELEVVCIEKKSYVRMRPTKVRDYGPQFDALDFGSKRDVPEETETVIWSSKKDL
jgi:hypothetical protein